MMKLGHEVIAALFLSFQSVLSCQAFILQSHRKNQLIQSKRLTHTKTSPYLDSSSSNNKQRSGSDAINDGDLNDKTSLEELCKLLKATPHDLLCLKSDNDGERGVYINRPVDENDVLLQIPLASCIRDDKPPVWYGAYKSLHRNDVDSTNFHYNPRKWATRLAASLLDLQIRSDSNIEKNIDSYAQSEQDGDIMSGLQKWLSMMPNEDFLRASLPIHWPEEIVPYAKCTALELSIDASYFARAEALSDLISAINIESEDIPSWQSMGVNLEAYDLERIFDIVQTRSCRAERTDEDGIQLRPCLRILAPIFDFINHGSHRHNGEGCANAYFGLEGGDGNGDDLSLIVRALAKIEEGEEILIDYGDSARPAWRCLASYGFVPDYRLTSPNDELEEGQEDESVAEVFMDGGRYEVGSHTVPVEMVEAASAALLEEQQGVRAFGNDELLENMNNGGAELTPEIALRIAKRVSDAAFQLLIEPSGNEDSKTNDDEATVIAKQLASSLRWSQHQCLLACAMGLRDYAGGQSR